MATGDHALFAKLVESLEIEEPPVTTALLAERATGPRR
jgi:hypothetical protein